MTFERSHGKSRPTLPRSSDLAPVETDRDPRQGRTAGGHFAAGNRVGVGARWKASIKRLLGRGASGEQAEQVAREAFRLYLAVLRDMPSDGASVRMLVALQARHAAIAAFFTDRAAFLGLDGPEGTAALDIAAKHGQRAERLAVTSLDVSTRLTKASDRDPVIDIDAVNRRANDNLERKRVQEQAERDAEEAAE